MAPAQQSGSNAGQLILHHLSDVRYSESVEEGSNNNNILVQYQRYLLTERARERYPDIVVITGDLTTNGTRAELSAVMNTLRACFATWKDSLNEHVFIVPGPHDVNWESIDGVGLQTFYDTFRDFATPKNAPASGWSGPATGRVETFVGYALDTCYSPEDLTTGLKGNFGQYVNYYDHFLNSRARLGRRKLGLWKQPWRLRRLDRERARTRALEQLRKQYLELTEGARLIDLRAGRISAKDVERFEKWAQQQRTADQQRTQSATNGSAQPAAAIPPLKVLITHHPIDIRAEEDARVTELQSAQYSFKRVASTAREAGVSLALHGHIHTPQLFSDEALFEGRDEQRPLRQVGAPSLGDAIAFNEISAVYRSDQPGQGEWRLDVRLVNLKAPNAAATSSIEWLNRAETAAKETRRLRRINSDRREFERKLRYIMRRFSDQLYQARPNNRLSQSANLSLPQLPMQLVQDVISTVIFKGYETRVRLLLKNKSKEDRKDRKDRNPAIPLLVPAYLDPVILDGPGTLIYPASVAAWALVLGRTLIYPAITELATDAPDHEWLRRTDKFKELMGALEALRQEATSANETVAAQRYLDLLKSLEAIESASNGQSEAKIAGKDIYQAASGARLESSFRDFICVPYPMRPVGGPAPDNPEIAVLDVGVRKAANPDFEDSALIPAVSPDSSTAERISPFTEERIEMLETLTELIGVMLVSADTLGKPLGIWYDRSYTGV